MHITKVYFFGCVMRVIEVGRTIIHALIFFNRTTHLFKTPPLEQRRVRLKMSKLLVIWFLVFFGKVFTYSIALLVIPAEFICGTVINFVVHFFSRSHIRTRRDTPEVLNFSSAWKSCKDRLCGGQLFFSQQ